MRRKINFIIKISPLFVILSLVLIYSVNALFTQISNINEYVSGDLNWMINYGWVYTSETSLEITYGNEECVGNSWGNYQDRYIIEITDSSSPEIYASSANSDLTFSYENIIDDEGVSRTLFYIDGISKIPANTFNDTSTPLNVIINCKPNDGYSIGMQVFKIKVHPKKITNISWNKELIYNGYKQLPLGESSDIINDDICNFIFDNDGIKDVGENTLALTGVENTNYYLDDALIGNIINYSIVPYNLIVTPTLKLTYGEEVDYSKVEYDYHMLGEDEGIDNLLTITNIEYNKFDPIYDNSEVINYKITAEINTTLNNYIVTLNEGYVEVSPQGIELEYNVEEINIVYGEEIDLSSISYSNVNGFYNSDSLEELGYELTTNYSNGDIYENGEIIDYSITLSSENKNNYYIKTNPIKINISPKELEFIVSNTNLEFNGFYQKPSIEITNLVNDDECNLILSDEYGRKDSGSYTLYILDCNNSNYIVSTPYKIDFSISKTDVKDFTMYDISIEYNKKPYNFNNIPLPYGISKIDYSIYLNDTLVDEAINAGTYKIIASFTPDNNHNDVLDCEFYLTIKPVMLTIVLDYSNLTYNGAMQTVNPIVSGVIGDDLVNLEVSGNTQINSGDYNMNVSIDNINYQVIGSIPWSISKKEIEFDKPQNVTSTYNGQIYELINNLPEGVAEIKYTIYLDDNIVTDIKNAGTYKVVSEYITDSNYQKIANQEFIVTILPKEVTIKFEYFNSVYDGENKHVDVNVDGIVDDVKPIISGNEAKDTGDYTASVTIDDPNYVIKGENEYNWSIIKGNITPPNIEDITKTYDKIPVVFDYELPKGLKEIKYTITLDGVEVFEIVNAGVYTVVINYIVDSMYNEIPSKTITVTINKRIVDILVGDRIKYYNGFEQALLISYYNVLDEDDLNIEIEGNVQKDVGIYEARIIKVGNPNYELSSYDKISWEIKEVVTAPVIPTQPTNPTTPTNTESNHTTTTTIIITDTVNNDDVVEKYVAPISTGIVSISILAICFYIFRIKKNII